MKLQAETALRRNAPESIAGPRLVSLWSRATIVVPLVACVLAGVIALATAMRDVAYPRAWQAYLVNLLFWLGIAQGGVVVSASLYLTQGRWGGLAAYRLAEAFGNFIPLGFILFWALYFGRVALFPWISHPIPQKAAWLNTPFLFARDGLGLLTMTALSMWLMRLSHRPDVEQWIESPKTIQLPPTAIRRLAPAIALVYAAVYSLIGFDLVMSLSPLWHSTLFGAYFFAGAFWCAIAAMALVACVIGRRLGAPNRFSEPDMLHDIGKFLFAFSVFWAYLLFSQYIVIWYGDIPVETFFIVVRVNHLPWAAWSWTAFALIWGVPFVVLLGRKPKQTPAILGTVALLGVIGIYIERYLLVVPSLSPREIPYGWIELLITLGFFGLFGLCSLSGLDQAAAAALAQPTGVEE